MKARTAPGRRWPPTHVILLGLLLGLAVLAPMQRVHAASPRDSSMLRQARSLLADEEVEVYEDGDPGDPDISGPVSGTPVEGAKPKAANTPAKTAETPAKAAATPAASPAPKKKTHNQEKRPEKAPKHSKVVELAPEVNITYGGDINDDGPCEKEIERYCDDEEQGDSKLADCISDSLTYIELTDSDGDDVPVISDECREDVFQFKIQQSKNINANVPLAIACRSDAERFCNMTWFFGYKAGQITACLRDVLQQLTNDCRKQVFKTMLDAANDFRADPQLYEACKDDADSLCKDVKNGGGRIQGCLRDKRMQLSWACEEQLFRQETENADDIRLSVRLFARCMPDKKKFCKDIEPGHSQTKNCLEENREQLSAPCKEEIDSMIERRVHDFRLDSKLKSACENEIFDMCAFFGELDDMDAYDSSVINCLQDYRGEIKNEKCLQQVKKYVELAASDIRFDVPLAEACYDDRKKFCGNVPPGSARVIRCLTKKRGSLSPICRATLFDEEVRFSENIDFQAPMKSACKAEIDKFCKDVPHGDARVIRCLQDNKEEKDFGKHCLEEVQTYEEEISKDYRLNYRLRTACEKDVDALCPNLCSKEDVQTVCGGKVLRCLTDKIDDIKDEACSKEVLYFEKMEVSNFKNDVILAEACRADVDTYCSKVEPGEGRIHQCLRENRAKLSPGCEKEELLLEEKEATNIELSGNLLKACRSERQMYCKAVRTGSARVFRCLAENMGDADFGANCRGQIQGKLIRRQANWKLDPPLRKACRNDVSSLCSLEDSKDSEQGLVYKCMVQKYADLSSGCQKELGRAIHMAFFAYQPQAIITSPCDDDIQRLCLSRRPNMASRPGAVGSCLATILERQERLSASSGRRMLGASMDPTAKDDDSDREGSDRDFEIVDPAEAGPGAGGKKGRKLSDQCYVLADIAEPPNIKAAFDSTLSIVSLMDRAGSAAGLTFTSKDRRGNIQGVSLTGWVAVLGMAAMVLLILGAVATLVRRRVRGGGAEAQGYTLVSKKRGNK